VTAIPHDVQEAGGGGGNKKKKLTITICTKNTKKFLNNALSGQSNIHKFSLFTESLRT
jgi:hypothetical protein